MPSNLFEIITPIKLRSWKAVVVPLFLGTGVFTILYLYSIYAKLPGSSQRGLFEYHSTTFGDVLIVPLIWFLMAKHYSLSESLNLERKKTTILLVTALSLLITFVQTINSMFGKDRDWTLPSYGSINIQGIYHSLFIAFMLSSYFIFILDHWQLMSSTNIDASIKKQLSVLYWYILDLFVLFLALLSSDAYYNKNVESLFVNPSQQFAVFGVLTLNFIMTIKNKAVPFKNPFLFLSIQILVFIFTIVLSYFLSKTPIMW